MSHRAQEYIECEKPDGPSVDLNAPEPPPVGDGAEVWPLVIADMQERNREGVRKYGTPLRANNGRRALVDLYQEMLDGVVYLRQHLEEQGSCDPHEPAVDVRLADHAAAEQPEPMTSARALIRAMLDVLGAHEVLRVVNAASAYHRGRCERDALDQHAAVLERRLR